MRVSVCITTYNGEKYIVEQLRSILASPLVDEIIVSDDNSSDSTCALVLAIGDNRVRLIDGPRAGLIKNFEFALSCARGDIVFLADQDDVWLPRKVEVMLEALAEADLAVCNCRIVDSYLCELHPSFFSLRNSGPGLIRNLMRNSFLGCAIAMRRDLLERALPFPSDLPMHDWWLGLVAESYGRTVFIQEVLMLYRRHSNNASYIVGESSAGWITRLHWRWSLLKALIICRISL
jgi:glycosyltransferase involved in cell wall biosynthesis